MVRMFDGSGLSKLTGQDIELHQLLQGCITDVLDDEQKIVARQKKSKKSKKPVIIDDDLPEPIKEDTPFTSDGDVSMLASSEGDPMSDEATCSVPSLSHGAVYIMH
jgi:hypothetical protein